jgi:hypothetical protein
MSACARDIYLVALRLALRDLAKAMLAKGNGNGPRVARAVAGIAQIARTLICSGRATYSNNAPVLKARSNCRRKGRKGRKPNFGTDDADARPLSRDQSNSVCTPWRALIPATSIGIVEEFYQFFRRGRNSVHCRPDTSPRRVAEIAGTLARLQEALDAEQQNYTSGWHGAYLFGKAVRVAEIALIAAPSRPPPSVGGGGEAGEDSANCGNSPLLALIAAWAWITLGGAGHPCPANVPRN